MATMPEGGVLTIRAGFGILATEALQEDVSYVYNGTGFVALNAPSSESDYEITTPNDTHIKVGQDLQIEVRAADGITAYFRYAVNNKEIATISSLGVLRGLSEGTVTVSVWYGNLPVKTVTIIVDPLQKEDIESFEIVTDIDQFIIPVNGDPSGSTNYCRRARRIRSYGAVYPDERRQGQRRNHRRHDRKAGLCRGGELCGHHHRPVERNDGGN